MRAKISGKIPTRSKQCNVDAVRWSETDSQPRRANKGPFATNTEHVVRRSARAQGTARMKRSDSDDAALKATASPSEKTEAGLSQLQR